MGGPAVPRIVYYWQHRDVCPEGQLKAASGIRLYCPRLHSCPFWKKQNMHPFVYSVLPFEKNLEKGLSRPPSVYGYWLQEIHRPTPERYINKLPFKKCTQRMEDVLHRKSFPLTLVVRNNYTRAFW